MRIATQEDRLLIHPKFAGKKEFPEIREMDFKPMNRELSRIEILSPINFQKDDTPIVLYAVQIPSSTKGKEYQVQQIKIAEVTHWECTCEAFVYGRANPCKHIQGATLLQEQDKKQAVLPTIVELPNPKISPSLISKLSGNTSSESRMADASKPIPVARQAPAHDAWNPTPTAPVKPASGKVVPVGARITMGGSKK
jgi:hypothetical protein